MDTALALRMMLFCFDLLQYPQCPSFVPDIIIDPDLDVLGRIDWDFFTTITLRQWDEGIFCHEVAHFLQEFNGLPFSEEEAERARHAWLREGRC